MIFSRNLLIFLFIFSLKLTALPVIEHYESFNPQQMLGKGVEKVKITLDGQNIIAARKKPLLKNLKL